MNLVTPDAGLLFWMVVIFGLLFFLLWKFGFPVITSMVEKRNSTIEKSLKDAHEIEARMGQMVEEHARMLEEARKEQAQILREATDTRNKILAQAKDDAREEAAKILAEARTEIEAEKEAALRDVRKEVREGSRPARRPQGSRRALRVHRREDPPQGALRGQGAAGIH